MMRRPAQNLERSAFQASYKRNGQETKLVVEALLLN